MRLILVFSFCFIAATTASFAQSVIGTTSEAQGQITARGIDGKVRALNLGSTLKQNDTIRTGKNAIVELLFLDQTVMTLGPESELRLDELVYQPRIGGRFLTTLALGVARFFSGVQPKSAYAVQTPNATIGIRGTIFDVVVDRDQATTVVLRRGIVTFRNQSGVTRTIRKPNFASTARRANRAPSNPARSDRDLERKTLLLNKLSPARVSSSSVRKIGTPGKQTKATPRRTTLRQRKSPVTARKASVRKSPIKTSVLRSARILRNKINARKAANKR